MSSPSYLKSKTITPPQAEVVTTVGKPNASYLLECGFDENRSNEACLEVLALFVENVANGKISPKEARTAVQKLETEYGIDAAELGENLTVALHHADNIDPETFKKALQIIAQETPVEERAEWAKAISKAQNGLASDQEIAGENSNRAACRDAVRIFLTAGLNNAEQAAVIQKLSVQPPSSPIFKQAAAPEPQVMSFPAQPQRLTTAGLQPPATTGVSVRVAAPPETEAFTNALLGATDIFKNDVNSDKARNGALSILLLLGQPPSPEAAATALGQLKRLAAVNGVSVVGFLKKLTAVVLLRNEGAPDLALQFPILFPAMLNTLGAALSDNEKVDFITTLDAFAAGIDEENDKKNTAFLINCASNLMNAPNTPKQSKDTVFERTKHLSLFWKI